MEGMTLRLCHRLMIETIKFIRDCDHNFKNRYASYWREAYAKRLVSLKKIEAKLSKRARSASPHDNGGSEGVPGDEFVPGAEQGQGYQPTSPSVCPQG